MKTYTYKLGNGMDCTIIVGTIYDNETTYHGNVSASVNGQTYMGMRTTVSKSQEQAGIVAVIGDKIGIKSDTLKIVREMMAANMTKAIDTRTAEEIERDRMDKIMHKITTTEGGWMAAETRR